MTDSLLAAGTLAVRFLLACVLFAAAVGKVADIGGTRQTLRDFSVPDVLVAPGQVLLPMAELAAAALLVVAGTAWWGAVCALVLMVSFLAVMGAAVHRGRTPPCHCFGARSSRPTGPATLLRTGALAAVAGTLVALGPHRQGLDALQWVASVPGVAAVEVVLGVGLVVGFVLGTALFLEVLAQNGRLTERVEALEARVGGPSRTAAVGLPVGERAPGFGLESLRGRLVTLEDLCARNRPVLLVFSDPHCGPCAALLPRLVSWDQAYGDQLTIALVSRGGADANRSAQGAQLANVLVQRDREVAQAYRVQGTPTAVAIAPDGTVASPLAVGAPFIEVLVDSLATPGRPREAVAVSG